MYNGIKKIISARTQNSVCIIIRPVRILQINWIGILISRFFSFCLFSLKMPQIARFQDFFLVSWRRRFSSLFFCDQYPLSPMNYGMTLSKIMPNLLLQVHQKGNSVMFFVNDNAGARALKECSRKVTTPQGRKVGADYTSFSVTFIFHFYG